MTIQWYPGHMHKAQKEMRKSLSQVDIVIELIDARIPFSSENPLIASIRGTKPCIKVFNKIDLADEACVAEWQKYYEQQKNLKTLAISCKDLSSVKIIPGLCAKMLPHKADSVKKMRAMIVGIPNVGKSTLINALAGRAVAKTGNEPAVTKGQQFIQIDEKLVLLDTPGILWPKQQYESSSYRLASTGAIKDTAMEYADIAFFSANFLMHHYPQMLLDRYELNELPESELEFFETIGKKRGCLGGGGRVNLTKISEQFIHDLRAGAIGRICMETPAMVEQEMLLAELAEEALNSKNSSKNSSRNNSKAERK